MGERSGAMIYHSLRERGICTQCRKPNPTPEFSRCPDCVKRASELKKSNRAYAKKIGLCSRCHKERPLAGKLLCESCLEYDFQYYHRIYDPIKEHEKYLKRKAEIKEKGLCIYCKRKPAMEGRCYCPTCLIKTRQAKAQKKNDISRSERYKYGLCYTCGGELDVKGKVCSKCRERIIANFKNEERNNKCDLVSICQGEPSQNLQS